MNSFIRLKKRFRISRRAGLLWACAVSPSGCPAPDGGYGQDQGYGPKTLLRVKMRFSAFSAAKTIPPSALMRSIAPKAGQTIRPWVPMRCLARRTENLTLPSVMVHSFANKTGEDNTAIGSFALGNYRGGVGDNVAIGAFALSALISGNRNIALGSNAGANLGRGGDNIYIGNPGVGLEESSIRIGVKGTHFKAFIAGINGSSITGMGVVVNANGRLGTSASSARFKEDIKPMNTASEAILALKPVSFRYRKEVDPEGTPQFGLVAEDVEKVNPDLVIRDPRVRFTAFATKQ